MRTPEQSTAPHAHRWSASAPAGYIGFVLVAAGSAIGRDFDRRLASVGLRSTEFSTLFFLAHAPGIGQAELARRVFVSPQAMAKVLPELERRGLVERVPSGPGLPTETRLTDAGVAALERAQPIVEDANSAAGIGLNETDGRELLRLLSLIEEHAK
jgi:DNA-binding MarR family transcriptional regulator